jgi:hypothetical protein
MRLVLKTGDDGTAHIDPTSLMIKSRDAGALLTLALARGFVEPADEDALRAAHQVIAYCDARASVTADALRALTRVVKDGSRRSAAIIGSVHFDQSQQTTLDHLARGPAADEYWVSDALEDMGSDVPLLCYLGTRSTYYLNSFFELLETANEFIGGLGVEHFLQRILSTSKGVSRSNELSPASVFSCLRSPQYRGVVGVPLFEREHRKLVEDLTTDVTGQVLPNSVLEQFRIAAGPAALADGVAD